MLVVVILIVVMFNAVMLSDVVDKEWSCIGIFDSNKHSSLFRASVRLTEKVFKHKLPKKSNNLPT
jgi:hypothetical protein